MNSPGYLSFLQVSAIPLFLLFSTTRVGQFFLMSEYAESFPPILGSQVHTLILGTVPGQASLKATQYYAHPRNAFWPIMMAIIANREKGTEGLKFNPSVPFSYEPAKSLDYTHRCQQLSDNGYAIWDVLASCTRPGSLDSKIVKGTEQPNDIANLVRTHPELTCIVCNGRTAENLLKRHITKALPRPVHIQSTKGDELPPNAIRLLSLPSTSPSMASLTLADKYQVWAEGLLG
ncbi:MAG: TDG/mug DNA glycosylase family protein [bacterium]|jgi:hypoxanthine-DNA glycosylase